MRKFAYLFIGMLILVAFVFSGCGRGVDTDETTSPKYDLRGGIVKNLDTDSTLSVLIVTKDNIYYPLANIVLYGDTLIYDTAQLFYWFSDTGSSMPSSGTDTLKITDSLLLDEKFALILPNDFLISSISLPENRINAGGASVQLQWQTSLQSDGYILGVVMMDSIYTDGGYSEFVSDGFTSATIPPDAFRIYGDSLTIGWYYVYVYSYTGSPASTYNLPTSIPAGLTDNISKPDITGRFGTIVVTMRDSIFVDAQ